MNLLEKEYWLLTILTDCIEWEGGQIEVKELARQQLKEELSHLLPEVEASEAFSTLQWLDYRSFGELEVHRFGDQQERRWFVFSYKGASWEKGLYQFHHEETIRSAVLQYIEEYRGEGTSYVSGHGLGGAYALTVAASAGGMEGIVFDAPGAGTLLNDDQKAAISVVNYISMNRLFAALGQHPETVRFAKESEAGSITSPAEHWSAAFVFDAQGRVQVEEQHELFSLVEKMNIISGDDHELLHLAVDAFAQAVGLEEKLVDEASFTLLAVIGQIESGQLMRAMRIAVDLIKQKGDEHVRVWRKQVKDYYDTASHAEDDDMDERVMEWTDSMVTELGETVHQFYQYIEAILAAIFLYYADDRELMDDIEQGLEVFAARLELLLEEWTDQMEEYIEQMSENYILSFFDFWDELEKIKD